MDDTAGQDGGAPVPPVPRKLPDLGIHPHSDFLMYFNQIVSVSFPITSRTKARLYRILAQMNAGKRFRGRALLQKLIAQLGHEVTR